MYFVEVLAVVRFIPVMGIFTGGPDWPSMEGTKHPGYQSNRKKESGSLPIVDFPDLARDSRRAEGPMAGPNTEFLNAGGSYERKPKKQKISAYRGLRIAGRAAAGGSGSLIAGGGGNGWPSI
jgi:hypothetical protein